MKLIDPTPVQNESEPCVLIEDRGMVRWLTINRDKARNALNNEVLDMLANGINSARQQPNLRAIVLTGMGDRAFCAGGDLKPKSATFGFDSSLPTTNLGNLLRAAHQCDLPMLARVNGHCLAGGMGLLAMCDLAIGSDHALFGLPEVKIGMFPMQVSAILAKRISPIKFAELCLTGEPVDATEALSIGLLNYIVPSDELDAKTAWLLGRITGKSPTGIRRGKHALRVARDMTTEQAIAYMETQLQTLAMTEDSKEGIASFNEKRPPLWTGK